MGLVNCRCKLRPAASTVVCLNLIIIVFGIINLAVDDYDDDLGIAQIVVGSIGFSAALLGLCCTGEKKIFMFIGVVLSFVAFAAWFAIFIWYCTWMADEPERNRNGWFWFFGILTCLFLFVAALDHFVLTVSFFLELKPDRDAGVGAPGSKV